MEIEEKIKIVTDKLRSKNFIVMCHNDVSRTIFIKGQYQKNKSINFFDDDEYSDAQVLIKWCNNADFFKRILEGVSLEVYFDNKNKKKHTWEMYRKKKNLIYLMELELYSLELLKYKPVDWEIGKCLI